MRLIVVLLCIGCCQAAPAQMKVNGEIKSLKEGSKVVFNVPFSNWVHQQNNYTALVDKNGRFSLTIPVTKAQTFFMQYGDGFVYLYGEPGKDLGIVMSPGKSKHEISFSGALGSENNFRQQLGLSMYELGGPVDVKNSPLQILDSIKTQQANAFQKLTWYKSRTTDLFRTITYYDIAYFAPSKLWKLAWDEDVFSTSNKDVGKRELWTKAIQLAHEGVALSNDSAAASYHYQQMISNYPLFVKVKYLKKDDFKNFIVQLLGKPFEEAAKEVRAKGEEYWQYMLYEKSLKGTARESTLCNFLAKCMYSGELEYQQEAYKRFTDSFPSSLYKPALQHVMQPYLDKIAKANRQAEGFVFEPAGRDYSNLDSIVAAHKGKVLYIDLWGSWCGPCREEFAFNKELKERFKNKGVEFLYIAKENRTDPEKYWKEMVAFYDLTGRHLLMGKQLESYFTDLYSGNGGLAFPSYILIDKTGKMVSIKAKRPSERELLYAAIEQLL
jgi:thiol-disulfide isomerase/thioredoxin